MEFEEKESGKLGVAGKACPSLCAKFIVKSYLLRRLVAAVSFTLCFYTLSKRFSKSRKDQKKRVLVPSKLPTQRHQLGIKGSSPQEYGRHLSQTSTLSK